MAIPIVETIIPGNDNVDLGSSLARFGTLYIKSVHSTDALRLPFVSLAAPTQTLTQARSGQTFVGAVDAVFTLPAASLPGTFYQIVTGTASAGTGLRVTATGSFTILAAGVSTAGNGSITNSGASDVIGDGLILISDGVSQWVGVAARGTWA